MQLHANTWSRWHSEPQTSSLLAASTFASVIGAVVVAASFAGAPAPVHEPPQLAPSEVRVDAEPDRDMETLLVEVITEGEEVRFRIGSQTAASAADLQKRLEPLARLGGPISVRLSHDGPFLLTASAVAACRDAGFTTVFLVAGKTSR